MDKIAVRLENVSFWFREKKKILDNINLQIPKGSIYGFLGPNGAGKTTTIRIILGLLSPNIGDVMLFEKSLYQSVPQVFSRIGSLIETPAIYDNLSGYDNLDICRKYHDLKKERIFEVLELVNLKENAEVKVKEYSLGMKQRLGLAIALMPEPELLILDEPTNGLDPNGIIEIRELLLKLNREREITVLISSHLLPEIERIATDIGIISKGKMVFQGKKEELQKMKTKNAQVWFRTDNDSLAKKILKEHQLLKDESELAILFEGDEKTKNDIIIID